MHASSTTRATCRQAASRHNLRFAQVLTESAKLAKNCLLVISLASIGHGRLAAHPGR